MRLYLRWRVYGGGFHKMEPKEMERITLAKMAGVLTASDAYRGQRSLFEPLRQRQN
jgi:hypothetical protein